VRNPDVLTTWQLIRKMAVVQGLVLVEGAATYQILEDRSSSSLKSTLAILHTVHEDFGSYEVLFSSFSRVKFYLSHFPFCSISILPKYLGWGGGRG
jgi:hypothetical protein